MPSQNCSAQGDTDGIEFFDALCADAQGAGAMGREDVLCYMAGVWLSEDALGFPQCNGINRLIGSADQTQVPMQPCRCQQGVCKWM